MTLKDLVAHDDGFAVLYLNGWRMTVARYDANGEKVFTQGRLIGNSSRAIHQGALAFNGESYGVYFGISGDGHEGDALVYLNRDGNVIETTWGWGCSHSIDVKIVPKGKRFNVVCLSDIYPAAGFNLNHSAAHLDSVVGSRSGFTHGRLGGITHVGDRLAIAYSKSTHAGWKGYFGLFATHFPHSLHKRPLHF